MDSKFLTSPPKADERSSWVTPPNPQTLDLQTLLASFVDDLWKGPDYQAEGLSDRQRWLRGYSEDEHAVYGLGEPISFLSETFATSRFDEIDHIDFITTGYRALLQGPRFTGAITVDLRSSASVPVHDSEIPAPLETWLRFSNPAVEMVHRWVAEDLWLVSEESRHRFLSGVRGRLLAWEQIGQLNQVCLWMSELPTRSEGDPGTWWSALDERLAGLPDPVDWILGWPNKRSSPEPDYIAQLGRDEWWESVREALDGIDRADPGSDHD